MFHPVPLEVTSMQNPLVNHQHGKSQITVKLGVGGWLIVFIICIFYIFLYFYYFLSALPLHL